MFYYACGRCPDSVMCDKGSLSLYIHVPFCKSRCDYCSFYSIAQEPNEQSFNNYLELVSGQIQYQQKYFRLGKIRTLYIGGGTPSGLGILRLEKLFSLLKSFSFSPLEYTVECNPEDISLELLGLLEKNGVTRLSMGIQSLQPQFLTLIGRRTKPEDNSKALSLVSAHWKNQLSLDLMMALPGQTEALFLDDLTKVLSWNPHHISIYELEVEKGTALYARQDDLAPVSDRQKQFLYRTAVRFLRNKGFHHYEVSNFCKPGFYSRHNSAYWRLLPYCAAGSGAVMMSGFNGTKAVRKSIQMKEGETGKDALNRWIENEEIINRGDYLFEILMMGLRTSRGAFLDRIEKLGGNGTTEQILKIMDSFGKIYKVKKNRLILTERGIEILNPILLALLEHKDDGLQARLT